MKVTRQQVADHEYVLQLTPNETKRLYDMINRCNWDEEMANRLEKELGAACLDQLRRIW